MLRMNYLGGIHERAKYILGEHCFEILSDDSVSEEEKNVKCRDAFSFAKSIVGNAETKIESLGLDPKSFPTIRTNKQGIYQFEHDATAKSNSSGDQLAEEPAVQAEPPKTD
jgi:hypothetical protein